ncbi:MAG: hypothetical protein ACT4QD_25990 [Acidobacteriota bacterium]
MRKPRPSKEYQRFTAKIDKLFAVPHDVVQRRIEEHRAQAAQNPKKRGPKPKTA